MIQHREQGQAGLNSQVIREQLTAVTQAREEQIVNQGTHRRGGGEQEQVKWGSTFYAGN